MRVQIQRIHLILLIIIWCNQLCHHKTSSLLFLANHQNNKKCNHNTLLCVPTVSLSIQVPTYTTSSLLSASSSSSSSSSAISAQDDERTKTSETGQTQEEKSDDEYNKNQTVTILSRGKHHIIAMKPPSVVCHHSNWTGSRKKKLKVGEMPEIPMLQRVRDAIDDIDSNSDSNSESDSESNSNSNSSCKDESQTTTDESMKKINLVHRLDRGASGILLCAFADDNNNEEVDEEEAGEGGDIATAITTSTQEEQKNTQIQYPIIQKTRIKGPTAVLQEEMSKSSTIKTYVALVRGEGILHGEDMKEKGWFEINRPIKDEKGRLNDAITLFHFVAGQAEPTIVNGNDDADEQSRLMQPRISLVLARPQHGRWHQIRRHLNGLSHPILGDTSHGSSKSNREWKEKRNLPGERICLHLARLQMSPTKYTPDGIDISCPIPQDMLDMLQVYAPNVLREALPILEQEGVLIQKPTTAKYMVGRYKIPESFLQQMNGAKDTKSPQNTKNEQEVTILSQGDHYVVASKPHGVVVHNSSWTKRRRNEPIPMLQRVRDATGRKVNPIHRLDRSASGCLVFAFADETETESSSRDITNTLIQSLQSDKATKTYLALCDGDGEWNGVNYFEKGWFTLDRPVKDENDKFIEAKTDLRFIATVTLPEPEGEQDEKTTEGRKISIVLAKPRTGRYHQIRQHMASGRVGHAILGDSSHGLKRTNRIWKKKRGLLKERTCLHLLSIDLPPTEYSPSGIQAVSPLPQDFYQLLNEVPGLLEKARPILSEEGITI